MAVSQADMNTIRVSVLGTSVDQATTWTPMPPGSANTLAGTERIINRVLNALRIDLNNAVGGTNAFSDRFSGVVGQETAADQAAFDSIGMNLIQAVAALIAGGGVAPGAVTFTFEFPDPLNDGDFVEVPVTADVSVPALLAGSEYLGVVETEDITFELTVEPAGTAVGELEVLAGTDTATLDGPGATLTTGDTLRMTAHVSGGAPLSPAAIISIVAQRKPPEVTTGRYVHEQSTPSNSWSITHNLGFAHVLPQIVSASGNTILADITYLTNDTCRLDFATAVSGTAILRK